MTEREIAFMQGIAFLNYEEGHGRRPKLKGEKMLAYDFIIGFIRDMNVSECVGYLKPFGIPLIVAVNLWHGLE